MQRGRRPYSPSVLSRYWREAVAAAGVRADQTARRPAHLRHADAPVRCAGGGDRGVDRAQRPTLTMRLYAHSQDDALKAAGATLDRVVSDAALALLVTLRGMFNTPEGIAAGQSSFADAVVQWQNISFPS